MEVGPCCRPGSGEQASPQSDLYVLGHGKWLQGMVSPHSVSPSEAGGPGAQRGPAQGAPCQENAAL